MTRKEREDHRKEREKEREERKKKRQEFLNNFNPIKWYLIYHSLKTQSKIVLIITGVIVALIWYFAQRG